MGFLIYVTYYIDTTGREAYTAACACGLALRPWLLQGSTAWRLCAHDIFGGPLHLTLMCYLTYDDQTPVLERGRDVL